MRRPLTRLVAAWTLAHFGYRASVIALPLVALQSTGSAWTVGLVAGAAGVPTITAPWWTRRWQSRLRTASALAALLAAEGVATLVVPVSAVLGLLSPAVMVTAGLAIGVLNALSGPLDAALVAALGERRDPAHGAAQALAVQDTGVRVAMTLAPLATLPLIGWVGPAPTAALEGLLSLVAVGIVTGLRVTTHDGPAPERPPRVRGLLTRHPEVAAGWLARGVGCAAWFALTLGLAVLGVEQGHGALFATVGLTAYSGAAVLGSAGGVLAARARRPCFLNAAAWLIAGVGILAMALWPHPVPVAMAAALMGLVVPAGNAATSALVTQATVGLERRAALTAQSTVVVGCSTLGALVGGPLIALFGPRGAMAGAGVVVAVVALVVAIVSLPATPRTRRRPQGCREPQGTTTVPT